MTQKLLVILIAAFLNVAYINVLEDLPSGDHDIFIYGKVFTEDGEVYTGQIRWGKEEAFWFDFFNSSKRKNEYIDYLSKNEARSLNRHRGEKTVLKGWMDWNNFNDHSHSFACQFGNIKAIEMGRGSRIELEFKNGEKMELKGGSNDIKTYVQVTDAELGHIKLDWNRIERVEFMKADAPFESRYGNPLYGRVQTESGATFTGYVQWDHDERLSYDELNGENRDGDIDLEFGNIKKIVKTFRGSKITTQSGREIELRGTNDVNDDNRGIIVNISGQGRVDIPWDEFEEVQFENPKQGLINYSDFDADHYVNGTVTTIDGKSYNGQLAYDLDESYQLEILNGKKDDIEYFIPFNLIKKISPAKRDRAEVTLVSGKVLVLEDSVDVSEDNDGVLVFIEDDDDPIYIAWENIEEINF